MEQLNLIAFPLDEALKILKQNFYKVYNIKSTKSPFEKIKPDKHIKYYQVTRVVRQKFINLREVELTVSNFKTLSIKGDPLE